MTTTLTVLGGIISAVVTGDIAYAIASRNASATATSAITAPYRDLVARVVALEDRDEEKSRTLARLRDHLEVVIRDRDQLVSYIRELSAWMHGGQRPPAPTMPAFLAQHLDPSAFDVAHITERVTTTTTTYVTPPEGD
jgi:hypothetical protein